MVIESQPLICMYRRVGAFGEREREIENEIHFHNQKENISEAWNLHQLLSTNLLNELGIYVFVNSLLCQCDLLSIRNLTIRSSRNKPFTILSQSLDFWASPNFCFYFFNGFIAEEYSSTSYTIYIYMYVRIYVLNCYTKKDIRAIWNPNYLNTPYRQPHVFYHN